MTAIPVPFAVVFLAFMMWLGASNVPHVRGRLRRHQIGLVIAEGVALVGALIAMVIWPELFFFWR